MKQIPVVILISSKDLGLLEAGSVDLVSQNRAQEYLHACNNSW